jgi:dethiobiotin synthetase
MSRAYFVTGTDTGVGKTLMACALLHAFARGGKSVVGMKPVAAGCDARNCEDVDALRAAGNVDAPREWINPYALPAPVAPHLAARLAGITLELAPMLHAYRQLQSLAEVVIVEGVGGWLVPFNDTQGSADLAQQLGLPVIMVVGMRLGCLNHALLTAQAIQAQGLQLAGWVANRIDPAMALFDENVQTLQARLAAPLLGSVPYNIAPRALAVADLLNISVLA